MSDLRFPVHFRNGAKGKKRLKRGKKPAEPKGEAVPRVTRLLALAIHFDQLIRDGVVDDYADLARLGKVSRARITQVMDLLNLAPDLQEDLLAGQQPSTTERSLRVVVADLDWAAQRRALVK